MKVVSINEKTDDKRKEDMLEVINEIRDQIEAGEITEFVACSLDLEGLGQIHDSVVSYVTYHW